ncbi:MAG TPA: hypothetical protein VIH54_15285 [Chthoniobacterales bacterium]
MARNPLADRPDRAIIVSACLPFLEKLHSPLVLLRRRARGKCPQIPTLPRLCILLPRVKPVLSRLYFSNHAKEDAVARDRVVGNKQGPGKALAQGILGESELAPVGSALEIPLVDVGGIGLANLRSAVHRAATSQGLAIETLADETNFYVWKTANSK